MNDSNFYLVVLSTSDSNLWSPLLAQVRLALDGVAVRDGAASDEEFVATKIGRSQKYFTKKEIEILVADYKAGETVYELAKKFGCHRQTVSRHLKASGVNMRMQSIGQTEIKELIRLYESGLTLKSVGLSIGVSRNTVRRELVRAGVTIRNRTDTKDQKAPTELGAYGDY